MAFSTVGRAAARFIEFDVAGLYDARAANGLRKLDDRFLRRVASLLRGTPEDVGWCRPTWTHELLCEQMRLEGFAQVAVCTMGRALAAIGARLGSPKPIVLCPWKRERREQRLAELRALEARASAEEPTLYADEVDIHLNPQIGREWMLRGHQRRIVTPGKNAKSCLAGALDVLTGELLTTGAARKTAALFCDLVRRLGARYWRARKVHVVLDNYGVHKAKAVERVLADFGGRIELHFLPPSCPQANRIERVWQDLHANVTRNHRCTTLEQPLDNAANYLDVYRWNRRAE